ncbi:MAG: prepilin-type N-terminal cleavage/methylation domain-containing protein [Syntrophaceae bacterium]|nr:prepilin-type N-terminal cleavage/methylation domain-containing protein [Syntrophaceae bacterium]
MNKKGYSLVEVLVSLVLLSIAILGLTGLMVQTTNNNSFGCHITEAATFAQDQLENLKVSLWDNVVTGNDEMQGSTGINYSRSWVVVPNAAPPNDTVKEITITIQWNDKTSHSVGFRSVIFRTS